MYLYSLLAEVTPSPDEIKIDPNLVTPGPMGFAVIVIIVVLVVLLAGDMLRRVRRTRYREEVREALDAEQAADQQAADEAKKAKDDSAE